MGTIITAIIGIALIAAGLWVFVSGSKQSKAEQPHIAEKDGIPVLPRDQRERPALIHEGDALSNLAAAATQHNDADLNQSRFGFGNKQSDTKPEPKTDKVSESVAFSGFVSPTTTHTQSAQITPAQASPIADTATPYVEPTPAFDGASYVANDKVTGDKTADNNAIHQTAADTNKSSANDVLVNAPNTEDDTVAVYDEKLAKSVEQDVLHQFDGDATVLDQHLHGQEVESRNSQAQATQAISLFIRPKDGLGVSGQTILRLAQDYAMKYGVSNMFHRYEKADGTGVLWFSMLGLTHESIADFDLVALPSQNFNGLALFLSLPHKQALQGFDSMVAITKSMAEELDAEIFDENWEALESPQLLAMRNLVMG